MNMTRVAFADDSFLVREAVTQLLAGLPGVEVVAVCEDGDALRAAVDREQPAVVITDVRMPPSGDDEGIRIARELRERHPEIGVVILSQHADLRYGRDLLEHGAGGRAYLLKDRVHDAAELQAAIEIVVRGGSLIDPQVVSELLETRSSNAKSGLEHLTAREREVLALMAEGASNAAIAQRLVLTKRAVEKHVGSIFLKLGLHDEETVSRRVTAVLMYLAG
jgi:DNA-binding NarL/FixJ family response regulator